MTLDPTIIRSQIEVLKVTCPEAWDDGDDKLLHDMLEAETDLNEFLTVVEERRQDATAMAGAIATRIAELEQRQRRYEKREQAMRDLAFKMLQAADTKKVELPIATLSTTSGKPKVVIVNEDALGDFYMRTKKEPDKAKIKAALETGEQVPGACLSNAEPYLSIRVK